MPRDHAAGGSRNHQVLFFILFFFVTMLLLLRKTRVGTGAPRRCALAISAEQESVGEPAGQDLLL